MVSFVRVFRLLGMIFLLLLPLVLLMRRPRAGPRPGRTEPRMNADHSSDG